MPYFDALLSDVVGLAVLVGLIKITVWIVFVVLGIRFLWLVPEYLREIVSKSYTKENESAKSAAEVECSVKEDFESASTLK